MQATESTDIFLSHVFPGTSESMKTFRGEIERLNRYCDRYKGVISSVLLTGETGVGKTFAARAISAHSQWLTLTEQEKQLFCDRGGDLIFPAEQLVARLLYKQHLPKRGGESRRVSRLATVLGPELTDDLAASELFGHKRNAFTGAASDHPGIFGDDTVDDVLLDEIADLTPRVQAKLLQFMDTRCFRPVGGMAKDEKSSQHRLFLCTNRSLTTMVRNREFREDLYHRIQGHTIEIPPLRVRREIIRDLAFSILRVVNCSHRGDEKPRQALKEELVEDRYCLLPKSEWENGKPTKSNWVVVLTEDDLNWCEQHDWPGNIRELKHRLERYVYYNGHRRLSEVMSGDLWKGLYSRGTLDAVADDGAVVEELINGYLQRILDGGQEPPGRPSDIISHFTELIKKAVYRFKKHQRLGSKELKQIFPKAKDADSTIGRWRPSGGA